jgi:hypothetical protein
MKFDFNSLTNNSDIKLNALKLDIDKLENSLAIHSGNVTGFKALVDKFQIALFGYYKKDTQTINDVFDSMDKGIQEQINIYEANKQAFDKAGKTNKEVARFLNMVKNKEQLDASVLAIKEGTGTGRDYTTVSEAFQASSKVGDVNIEEGVSYKKSDYIKQLSDMIKQTSDNEEKEKLADTLVDFLSTQKIITDKRTEILNNLIKEHGVDEKFINQIEAIYGKQIKSKKDDVKAKSIDELRASGFKTPSTILGGMGVGSSSGGSIAELFGGMGGIMKMLGPVLPIAGAAGLVGSALIAAPGILPEAARKTEGIMENIGDTLLLLAIILPVIWDFLFGKKEQETAKKTKASTKEELKGASVEDLDKAQLATERRTFMYNYKSDVFPLKSGTASAEYYKGRTEGIKELKEEKAYNEQKKMEKERKEFSEAQFVNSLQGTPVASSASGPVYSPAGGTSQITTGSQSIATDTIGNIIARKNR